MSAKPHGFGYYLVIAVAVAIGTVGGKYLSRQNDTALISVEDYKSMLIEFEYNKTYVTLNELAPSEFSEFAQKLTEIVNTHGDEDVAFSTGAKFTTELRRQYAKYAMSSPDDTVRPVIDAYAKMAKALSSDEAACTKFLVEGPTAILPSDQERLLPLLDESAALTLRALFAGKDTPVTPRLANPEDYSAVVDSWVAKGATQADILAVASEDGQVPNYCEAMISFLEHLRDEDTSAADRARVNVLEIVVSQ